MLVVLLLVSVFAGTALAAEPTLVEATASPSTAAPGQPVRFTATLAEPAPAGGVELTLRIFGDWAPAPTIRVLVPASERTVSYDWTPPVGFRPFRDYQLQAYTGGVTVRAYFRANGLTDAGGYAVTAYDAPPTMVAGRSYPAVATINRPAPAGGLLLDWQQYGAGGPFIGAPRSVWVPAGSRKAGSTLHAPTQDLIAPGRLRTGIGLGFWSQPGGGPTFQKVDIEPYIVPKWFSITYHSVIAIGGQATLGLGLGENANPDGPRATTCRPAEPAGVGVAVNSATRRVRPSRTARSARRPEYRRASS